MSRISVVRSNKASLKPSKDVRIILLCLVPAPLMYIALCLICKGSLIAKTVLANLFSCVDCLSGSKCTVFPFSAKVLIVYSKSPHGLSIDPHSSVISLFET